jgi:hypothetical protein
VQSWLLAEASYAPSIYRSIVYDRGDLDEIQGSLEAMPSRFSPSIP